MSLQFSAFSSTQKNKNVSEYTFYSQGFAKYYRIFFLISE